MHNNVNVMRFIWMPFFIVQYGFDQKANSDLMCQDCSSVWYDMNYVHCIHCDEEEEDNNDIVMYLNFFSMFCKPLLYRLCIQCHVTVVAFCVFLVQGF